MRDLAIALRDLAVALSDLPIDWPILPNRQCNQPMEITQSPNASPNHQIPNHPSPDPAMQSPNQPVTQSRNVSAMRTY
jgi:hypothetical protein